MARTDPHKPYRLGRAKAGLGLFATIPIKKGAFIIEYSGPRITPAEAARREARGARYMFEINSRVTIDGTGRRNMGRYLNHSCRPNAESVLAKGKIIFRAIKQIAPGDEITFDYGEEYFDLFIKPNGCRCIKCTEKRGRRR